MSRRRIAGDDSGVSLVELVVATAILALVLPLVGAVLQAALTSQRDVQSVTNAASSVQIISTSVEGGVRNASAIRRTTYAPASGTRPNELVVARTHVGGQEWRCEAWYYDAVAGVLYTRSVDAATVSAPITPPAGGATTGWTELARGVVPVARTSPAPNPVPLFTATPTARPTSVGVGLSVAAGTRRPALLSTTISKRPQGNVVSAPCF